MPSMASHADERDNDSLCDNAMTMKALVIILHVYVIVVTNSPVPAGRKRV